MTNDERIARLERLVFELDKVICAMSDVSDMPDERMLKLRSLYDRAQDAIKAAGMWDKVTAMWQARTQTGGREDRGTDTV